MENKKIYIVIGIIAIIAFVAVVAVILLDNDKEDVDNKNEEKINTTSLNTNNTSNENKENKTNNNTTNTTDGDSDEEISYASAAEKQMAAPKEGETIAVMHVKNFGDITFKFFEKEAPKAVENFLKHAKDGYYDGVKFHRVMDEFMIQGGDPKGNGTGGESIWGKGFEEEIDEELVPYRGALCMASSGFGKSSLGSQFFIVQANADDEIADMMKKGGYPEELVSEYKKNGGYLSLYGEYTVFGQVVEGMDVVDKIVKVEKTETSTGELSSPVEDIIIESIDVKTK